MMWGVFCYTKYEFTKRHYVLMIRKFLLGFLMSAIFFIVGQPFFVEAGIFLKPNSKNEKTEIVKKKKGAIFLPYKNSESTKNSKTNAYYKKKAIKTTHYVATRLNKIKEFDPSFISMRGFRFRSVEEVLTVASAYRAPKIQAMKQIESANRRNAILAQAKFDSYNTFTTAHDFTDEENKIMDDSEKKSEAYKSPVNKVLKNPVNVFKKKH